MKTFLNSCLMIVLSVFLIVLVILTSIVININASKLNLAIENTSYVSKTENEIENMLKSFLPEESVERLIKDINVKEDITKIVYGVNNESTLNEIKENFSGSLDKVVDRNATEQSRKNYINTLTDEYAKLLFPASEYSKVAKLYNRYISKITIALVISVLIVIGILIYFVTGKKMTKWALISIYNTIIAICILLILMSNVEGINALNVRISKVINEILANIKITFIIEIIIIIILSIFLNYKSYFKKKRK